MQTGFKNGCFADIFKIAALRDAEDEEFANDALTLLQSITSTTGPEEAGLDEEDLKIISVAVENQGNKSVGKGAELLDSLADVYKAEGADAITGKVAAALNLKRLISLKRCKLMMGGLTT